MSSNFEKYGIIRFTIYSEISFFYMDWTYWLGKLSKISVAFIDRICDFEKIKYVKGCKSLLII